MNNTNISHITIRDMSPRKIKSDGSSVFIYSVNTFGYSVLFTWFTQKNATIRE